MAQNSNKTIQKAKRTKFYFWLRFLNVCWFFFSNQDICGLDEQAIAMGSFMEYRKVKNGTYENSIFVISPTRLKDFKTIPLGDACCDECVFAGQNVLLRPSIHLLRPECCFESHHFRLILAPCCCFQMRFQKKH